MAVLLAEEGADDSCASARDGIAQVRRLCGGDEVIRVDADAQGFVAAVFADRPVGEFGSGARSGARTLYGWLQQSAK